MKYTLFLFFLFPLSLKAATVSVQNGNLTVQNGLLTIQAPYNPTVAASGCTFVQSTGNACVGAICSSTFNATPGVNPLILIGFVSTGENLDSTQITDKSGNVYASTAASAGTSSESLWVYKFNASATSSFWSKMNVPAAGDSSMVMYEFSGCVAIDTVSARTIASATPATTSVTTTASGNIAAILTYEGTTTTITKGASYTADFQQANNSTYQSIGGQHKATTAGAYTADWTLGTSLTARVSLVAVK